MGTIEYTIINGVAPFSVELSPYSSTTHTTTGTFQFVNVPDGEYLLTIIDSNDCEYEQTIVINPTVTTTTTTTISPNSIIVGHTEEPSLIFNQSVTNRTVQYGEGEFYLWMRTTNGEPLSQDIVISYAFSGNNMNIFFENLSDAINAEVIEDSSGPAEQISGQLILRKKTTNRNGFIETFFKYGTLHLDSTTGLRLNLSSGVDWLNTSIPLTDATNIYGVIEIDNDNVIINY